MSLNKHILALTTALTIGQACRPEPRMDCGEIANHVGTYHFPEAEVVTADVKSRLVKIELGVTNPNDWLSMEVVNADENCMGTPVHVDFYRGQFSSSNDAYIYYQPPDLGEEAEAFSTWVQVLELDERLIPTGSVIEANFWGQNPSGEFTVKIPFEERTLNGTGVKEHTDSMAVWQVFRNNDIRTQAEGDTF